MLTSLRKMGALMMLNIMQPVKHVILVLGSWGTKAPWPSSLRPMYAVLGLKRMAMTHTPRGLRRRYVKGPAFKRSHSYPV